MMTITERLTPIFRDIFDREDLTPTPTLTARDVAEWDSLSHIRLIVAVEKEFGIKFALGELQSLQNVGEMIALIEKKCR
jgi:acyl carrier protein